MQIANATLFLDALGGVVVAWLWLKMAHVAKGTAHLGEDHRKGLAVTCAYHFSYVLPRALGDLGTVRALDPTCLMAPLDIFPEEYRPGKVEKPPVWIAHNIHRISVLTDISPPHQNR